jgi:sarcosine oxidase subunit beta
MGERADVVIVGGGITGLAVAWELMRRRLRKIVLLERRFTGAGSSSRNIGRIRAMQLTPELARFAIAAQEKHRQLSDELGCNTLFWRPGYAMVFYEDSEVARMGGVLDMLRGLGLKPELLGGDETRRRLPVLAGGEKPVGGFFHADAVVHHDSVVYGYRAACWRAGVDLREGADVGAVLRDGATVAGVRVGDREIRAPLVVNATGGWSRELSALAEIKVPNTPIRREALVTETSQPFMDTVISFYKPTEGWFHQTLRGELVAGVITEDEPFGVNLASSAAFLGRTARMLLRKAPRLAQLRVVRQWAGIYDLTPDRKPTVGPVAARPGFVQANGCNGRGFALGPKIAELLAQWLDTGERPALLAPFDANRFAGREDTPIRTGDYYSGYASAAANSDQEARRA